MRASRQDQTAGAAGIFIAGKLQEHYQKKDPSA
jgi:hypothetical protein